MSLTIVVTCDVQSRYHGFLASSMLEIAPGTYVSPRLNRDARDRIWEVINDWFQALSRGSITMIWRDKSCPGDVAIKHLGTARRELKEIDGLLLTYRLSRTK